MKLKSFVLLVGIVLFALFNFTLGTADISYDKILNFFTGTLSHTDVAFTVLRDLRLPRVLAAIASGMTLSIAGLLMQTYFRNPLAGPYVLGITSGASLGVAFFIIASNFIGYYLSDSLLVIGVSGFAFIGTLVFMFIIYLVSLTLQQSVTVLIAGILLGTFANAMVTFLQNIANGLQLQTFVYWNMGSLNNTNLYYSLSILLIGLFSLIFLLFNSRQFDLWLIGEEQSQSSGLSKKTFTWVVFGITSLLTGLTTAYFGPIAFVGLISPHIARILFKTQLHSQLFLYTAFIGIFLMLLSDSLLQLFFFAQLPLNTITSLLSLPILALLFLKKKELWM